MCHLKHDHDNTIDNYALSYSLILQSLSVLSLFCKRLSTGRNLTNKQSKMTYKTILQYPAHPIKEQQNWNFKRFDQMIFVCLFFCISFILWWIIHISFCRNRNAFSNCLTKHTSVCSRCMINASTAIIR